MPVDFLPGDVLPGHHQGLTLCFGALPLTHRFTFQNTGPTSAYPGRYSWPWLLRASLSRMVKKLEHGFVAGVMRQPCLISGLPMGHSITKSAEKPRHSC